MGIGVSYGHPGQDGSRTAKPLVSPPSPEARFVAESGLNFRTYPGPEHAE